MQLAPGWFGIVAILLAATPSARAESCAAIEGAPTDLQCRVDEAGTVKGTPALHYRLQSYHDGDIRVGGGIAVSADGLAPVAATYAETAHYDRPELIDGAAGRLLLLSGHLEGTGNFDASALYALEANRARAIDTDAWQRDLAQRLPQGLGARKGVFPDYRTMRAETPLWRATDAECCPTGGHASITLAIAGDKLVIGKLVVRQSPPSAQPKSAASTGGETRKICGHAVTIKLDAASFTGPPENDLAARATAESRGPVLISDAFDDLCAGHALSAADIARRIDTVTIGWAGGADVFTAYFPEKTKGLLSTQWGWQGTGVPEADDVREGILCAFTPQRKACADRAP